MEKVLNQAELLAEAILESEEYIRMRLLEQAAMKDGGASVLVAEYSEKRSRVESVLTSNDMDHAELASASQALEEAEKAIDEYALLKDMREARANFSAMMEKVNAIIRMVVTGESPEESAHAGGCGGSCSTCGGCGGRH
jgi:cell fate (sporulation/competence/biofilm development) regulator YlbF (YheA/YmcA/DUF963 family)